MTTKSKTLFRIKGKFTILFLLAGIFICSRSASGYVLPAEQILEFMIKNFSGFKTVTLIQSTLQTMGGNEKVFTEQLWLESPDKYSTKALDRLAERDNISPDLLYRQLFMANDREKIERLLLPLGIDLSKTSLTRVDGEIAYLVGDKDPMSPKLLVEKRRFLPLLIIYRVPGKAGSQPITVKFGDYQKQDKGWFPFEITYKEGENLIEKYTVQNFQANVPIDATILKRFAEYGLPEVPEPVMSPATPNSKDPDTGKGQVQGVIKTMKKNKQ